MGNPIPTQSRAIDSYASYNSNVVNALTRLISNGTNCIIASEPIKVAKLTSTSARVYAGHCIKDDVLIQISQIDIDFTDIDFYASGGGGHWNEDSYYYLVLEYTYTKSKPAPTAAIKIILPSQRTSPSVYNTSHLLLKVVEVTSNVIGDVFDYDPSIPANKIVFSNTGKNDIATPSADYDILPSDTITFAEGGDTMTLPPATFDTKHRIINEDGNGPVTIAARSGDTIEGNAQIVLNFQYDSVTLMSNRSNIWIEI